MELLHRFESGIEVLFSTSSDGDAREMVASGALDVGFGLRSGGISALETVRQVHSNVVKSVVGNQAPISGSECEADGIVSDISSRALGVLVADCAPVAFATRQGPFGIAHAGWRGVMGGVLENTVAELRSLGGVDIEAFVGPCIKSECYEFKGPELELLVEEYGQAVASRTSWGTPSLDLLAAIRAILEKQNVELKGSSAVCTACSGAHFSYRAKRSIERHIMVVAGEVWHGV